MAQTPIHVKNQLKLLRKISSSVAENAPAGIVDVRIKDLSANDLQRAVYALSNSFAELAYKQKVIVDVIKQTQESVKTLLLNHDLSREELEEEITKLILNDTIVPNVIPTIIPTIIPTENHIDE